MTDLDSETTSGAEEMGAAIVEALRKLKGATPRTRNGPCWQAINILRNAVGLDPMEIGGCATDGLPMTDAAPSTQGVDDV